MFSRLLSMGGIEAALMAQPDPTNMLLRAREKVMQTIDRLPKYLCTQTIDRREYEPDRGKDVPSCDQIVVRERGSHRKMHLSYSDRLRLDVAVSAGGEIYSWVGESHFADRSLFDLVGHGTLSTGTFANFLRMIFGSDAADFSYVGETRADGRTLSKFDFHVAVEKSHYDFGDGRKRWRTAYEGSVLINSENFDLAKLTVRTSQLPAETGACQAETTLQYGRFRLNNADFLLPVDARLTILNANGIDMDNQTVYTACHEFLGESTLRAEPAPEPDAQASKAEPLKLPADLAFAIALAHNIDTASAAAGDSFAAQLATTIRDSSSKVLVAKGTAITGRIVRIERYYHPVSSLMLALKLETVELGGVWLPLAAVPAPERASTRGARSQSGLRLRARELGTLDSLQEPGVAVFQLEPVKHVKRGSEFKWMTAEQ